MLEAVSESDEHERGALARLTLLARVGAILGSGLRRQETLEHVADLLVPGFAAWCAIDLEGPTASSSAVWRCRRPSRRCRPTPRTVPRS